MGVIQLRKWNLLPVSAAAPVILTLTCWQSLLQSHEILWPVLFAAKNKTTNTSAANGVGVFCVKLLAEINNIFIFMFSFSSL